MDAHAPAPDPARLRALIDWLEHGLLEREAAVRLALLAALAGEHVLLVGPPGTARARWRGGCSTPSRAHAGSSGC
ncbi:hypothetical protein [Methylibium sp. T29]|uniref:hypothetical protein n=1 Tax=Methylibium sp. T29 TaxID=1430884 RepID=UPI0003F44F3E|nr:hypothetical protein [Methylibium sp. T29]EWS53265.1 ATPase RavA [Methylibium sp. T29]